MLRLALFNHSQLFAIRDFMNETACTSLRRILFRLCMIGWSLIREPRAVGLAVLNIENVRGFEAAAGWLQRTEGSRFVWRLAYFQKFQHRTSPENPFCRRSMESRPETQSRPGKCISAARNDFKTIGCHFNNGAHKKFDVRVTVVSIIRPTHSL